MRLKDEDFSKLSKVRFLLKKTGGFSEKLFFLKTAETSIFAVKCDWNLPISQSVQNLVFSVKNYGFFEKKCFAWKNSKGSKFAVECDWTGKISQNSKKIRAVFQKTDWFFRKKLEFFKNR